MWTPHRHTECVSESHLAPDCEFYFSSVKRSILSVCVFFCVCECESLLVLIENLFSSAAGPLFFIQSSSMMAISFSCHYCLSQAVSWEHYLSGFFNSFLSFWMQSSPTRYLLWCLLIYLLLSVPEYLTFFSSALLVFLLGCVERHNRLCDNVFVLTMQFFWKGSWQ